VTPGSGPGHLGLFGYDPVEYADIKRGVIEAAGVGFDMKKGDVASRSNFCTVGPDGNITDRRAGRIRTEITEGLCKKLNQIGKIDGVKITCIPSMDYRFVTVFQGKGLSPEVTETDPLEVGLPIRQAKAKSPKGQVLAKVVNKFLKKGLDVLKDESPANAFLMRGFSTLPKIPQFTKLYSLNSLAIAAYPMYRGLARLVGMEILATQNNPAVEFQTYLDHYDDYNFFFIHIKGTDSAGEDGDFPRKVRVIEEVDAALPILFRKKPDVLAITGDHSSPAMMKSHSWHPVPVLIHSEVCGSDGLDRFYERNCNYGSIGILESRFLIPMLLANAGKLVKFGA
jgi:2,3-bisphosphoglycerate-independent phosphoglycerate mutase